MAWDDTIRAGERIQVTDTVTFAPAEGWGLVRGFRTMDVTAGGERSLHESAVINDGVTFFVQTRDWTGTPRAAARPGHQDHDDAERREGFHVSTRP
ncbi:hypothetical protein DVA67_001310 [Solirubrobacter sp. CPCC 204708]|uniref:MaoC family dehydratase n=1 Tax=Solirubrobacter deserti TaxID=2282478 RepID=A0ABT4RE45_9ACTN|nr:hypothetical protein [Solirubrobacter deserti]MBE2314596.1 hypothetical protein [Solirubrobacter deserti]MDA0136600.1 hypothetical protein [Solirubrobacter deserti]